MKTKLMAMLTPIAVMAIGTLARANVEDFEDFVTGQSVNGQGGWTVEDQWGNTSWGDDPAEYDQEVVNDGTGNKVWRISNAVTSGGLSGQPMTQVTDLAAGESGSALWNDRGSDHTNPLSPPNPGAYAATNYFYSAFDFKSATGTAQEGLSLTVSPTAKQFDGRQSYLSLSDDGVNGIDVFFYATGHTEDVWGTNGSDEWVEIASDLSYADWHRIEIAIEFVDGLKDASGELYGNDIVTVSVNGSTAHTGTSWEMYWYGEVYGEGTGKQAVNCLTIPARGNAVPDTMGGGFYFDNVEISSVPEPTSLMLLIGAALSGLLVTRRRRR